MTKKQELTLLLEEGKTFASTDIFNCPLDEKIKLDTWINKVNLFAKNRLIDNELKKEITDVCFFKDSKGLKTTYQSLTALLLSLVSYITTEQNTDNNIHGDIINSTKNIPTQENKKYDVFISHAYKDKLEFVNDLCTEIKKLGVNVFYDTDIFSWGDKWKQKIYEGTEKSEFAIIVISDNFFGREWTEKELKEFLERQNVSGQKIILPLLYNITFDDLESKYPSLCDIQCIKASDYNNTEICVLFARELIKRLKGLQ